MKKIILTAIIAVVATIQISFAQQAKVLNLEQTPGVFTLQEIVVAPGTYVFEVTNNGVDHEVGFVLAPEGKTDQKDHIKAAYVQKTINNGETSTSKEVTLTPGSYVYFCPLNPTPQYKLTVK